MKLKELLKLDSSQQEEMRLSKQVGLLIELRTTFGLDEILTLPQFVDFLETVQKSAVYGSTMRDMIDKVAITQRNISQEIFMSENPVGSKVSFNADTFEAVDIYGLILQSKELSELGINPTTVGCVVSHFVTGFVEVSFDVDELKEPIHLHIPYTYLVSSNI